MSMVTEVSLLLGSADLIKDFIVMSKYDKCYMVLDNMDIEIVFEDAIKVVFEDKKATEPPRFISYLDNIGIVTLKKSTHLYKFKKLVK